jgi:hypothetical protein
MHFAFFGWGSRGRREPPPEIAMRFRWHAGATNPRKGEVVCDRARFNRHSALRALAIMSSLMVRYRAAWITRATSRRRAIQRRL